MTPERHAELETLDYAARLTVAQSGDGVWRVWGAADQFTAVYETEQEALAAKAAEVAAYHASTLAYYRA